MDSKTTAGEQFLSAGLGREELVRLAAASGLAAVGITDHDTVSGYAAAAAAGVKAGVEVVPGIEISTKYGGAVHILGYCIDPLSPSLDHVVPRSRGGDDAMGNLRTAHMICNAYRRDREDVISIDLEAILGQRARHKLAA